METKSAYRTPTGLSSKYGWCHRSICVTVNLGGVPWRQRPSNPGTEAIAGVFPTQAPFCHWTPVPRFTLSVSESFATAAFACSMVSGEVWGNFYGSITFVYAAAHSGEIFATLV